MLRNSYCTVTGMLILICRNKTRKLSYRKDDRAMRPMYGCPVNFRESLSSHTRFRLVPKSMVLGDLERSIRMHSYRKDAFLRSPPEINDEDRPILSAAKM